MTLKLAAGILVVLGTLSAQARELCTGPFHQPEVCQRMRYLKATVNSMDSQRELVQVNYPYMENLGRSMKENVVAIMDVIDLEQADHLKGLKLVKNYATDLETLAQKNQIESFKVANSIRQACTTCHSQVEPVSGVKWGDVFSYDWEKVSQKCNEPGRNPYTCRSMNGLLTSYSHILTAYVAGVQDYSMMKQDSLEIARLLQDMKKAGSFHIGEDIRAQAEKDALEVARLAEVQDAGTFEKAALLAQSCNTCHEGFGRGQPFRLNPFSLKR